MRKMLLTGVALGLGLAFSGAANAQIKLGVGGPITGPNATFGAQLKNGAEQAAEDINAAGGIMGQKIQVVVGDDVSDPKQGVSVANKFSGEGVKMVVGHFNSGVSIPASEVYQEAGIVQITPASTNPRFTERNMWNTFRTCGRDDQQGAVAGAYLASKFKGKKVAIIDDKTPYGKGLADETRKAMNGKGLKETMSESINTGEKDYSALVSKIKQAQCRRRLFRRPAHGSRAHHPADARPGRQGAADGRRRHRLGRVRVDRRARRRGHPDDLQPRPAQEPERQGRGRQVQGQEHRPGGLHPLRLRGRADPEGGRRAGQVHGFQEDRRGHEAGQAVQDRDRRHLLRQEGRHHPSGLHHV